MPFSLSNWFQFTCLLVLIVMIVLCAARETAASHLVEFLGKCCISFLFFFFWSVELDWLWAPRLQVWLEEAGWGCSWALSSRASAWSSWESALPLKLNKTMNQYFKTVILALENNQRKCFHWPLSAQASVWVKWFLLRGYGWTAVFHALISVPYLFQRWAGLF